MNSIQKNAIVTGGTTGIGLGIVLRLLEEGFKVGFFGSSYDRTESARMKVLEAGFAETDFIASSIDLREHQQIIDFFDAFRAKFGPIGALINNAAISPKINGKRVPLHEAALELWQDVLNVNLTSAFLCTQQVLPEMMVAKFGRIVMVGSIAARALPKFAGSAYVASKAGLGGLARSVASEYASYGVTANTIAPGNVATEMTGGMNSPQNITAAKNIPAGRIGVPNDFVGLIAFLCSQEAAFINGATIDVTGGEYICP